MAREADKHIRVTEETWKRLNRRKEPGDSFEDVIQRLLKEGAEGNPNRRTAATTSD